MVKHSFILMIIILLFCSAGYAQMTVSDSDDNVLMRLNDEGTSVSILLPKTDLQHVSKYKKPII